MARLIDVAKKASVSVGTVSKILNRGVDHNHFSSECIDRVWKAARELGYRPNYHARALQTGRSHAIGLVVHAQSGPSSMLGGFFWGPMIGGVDHKAREMGCDVVIVGPKENTAVLDVGLRYLDERRIDALILPGYIGRSNGPAFANREEPIVFMEYYGDLPQPSVVLDPAPGIEAAVKHLVEHGHRDILWFGNKVGGKEAVPERRKMFAQCIKDLDVRAHTFFLEERDTKENLTHQERLISSAHIGFAKWLKDAPHFTAALCYNELTAMGAAEALTDTGRKVPDDVSLIGFDDIYATVARPAMTVISHRLDSIGERAVELAMDYAFDEKARAKLRGHIEKVPATLVVRDSTGPAPKA